LNYKQLFSKQRLTVLHWIFVAINALLVVTLVFKLYVLVCDIKQGHQAREVHTEKNAQGARAKKTVMLLEAKKKKIIQMTTRPLVYYMTVIKREVVRCHGALKRIEPKEAGARSVAFEVKADFPSTRLKCVLNGLLYAMPTAIVRQMKINKTSIYLTTDLIKWPGIMPGSIKMSNHFKFPVVGFLEKNNKNKRAGVSSKVLSDASLKQLQLKGVLLEGDKRWAIFSAEHHWVKVVVGDRMGKEKVKVQAIQANAVTVVNTKKHQTMILKFKV